MLWDPQSPPEWNDHVEQVLGMVRKAAKARERACGHDTALYPCDECKRARAVTDPEPVGPYVEPPIDAHGNPTWPEPYGDPYAEAAEPADPGNDKRGSDAWSRYRWKPVVVAAPAPQDAGIQGNPATKDQPEEEREQPNQLTTHETNTWLAESARRPWGSGPAA
eukprot:12057676-Heterocapsa_arctica.AAC.1